MKVKIFYPLRKSDREYLNSWMIKMTHGEAIPTKKDIEKDYKQLPIPDEFWKDKFNGNTDKDYILEEIFRIMNDDEDNPMSTSDMQKWIVENEVTHTSMSVADIVILDDATYICASIGWKEIKK